MIIAAMLTLLLAAPAFAESAPAGGPSVLESFAPLALIFMVFYLLVIRPQHKRMAEHKAMISAVSRGDEVITAGGLHGKIQRVMDGGTVKVEIADGVEVTVEQATLSRVKGKTDTPKATAEVAAATDKAKTKAAKKKAANDNG